MSLTILNAPLAWFQRVLWLGIAANVALAVPTLLIPERMLALFSLPAAAPLMWPRFAAWLLILLSAFYVPAAWMRSATGQSPGWRSARGSPAWRSFSRSRPTTACSAPWISSSSCRKRFCWRLPPAASASREAARPAHAAAGR